MKLRLFFKKFLIPRKLNRQDEDIFYEELKRKENQYNERYLKQVKDGDNKQDEQPQTQEEGKKNLDQGRRLAEAPAAKK